jgi:CRP/FNR family transcriptional regulator
MTKIDRSKVVKTYPVLEDLPDALMEEIEKQAAPVRATAGTQLFSEGTPCTHFPLLVEGTIRAAKCGPDGHEILLYRLNPGESCVITTLALLGSTPYPAMASAETNLVAFGLPRDLFLRLVLGSPSFRTFVFSFLSERMAHLMALIDDVAFRRLDQRLAARLLGSGESIQVTHQMLADELGTTRECVSRTLEALQESGMLRLGRRRIEILDRGALKRLHQPGVG